MTRNVRTMPVENLSHNPKVLLYKILECRISVQECVLLSPILLSTIQYQVIILFLLKSLWSCTSHYHLRRWYNWLLQLLKHYFLYWPPNLLLFYLHHWNYLFLLESQNWTLTPERLKYVRSTCHNYFNLLIIWLINTGSLYIRFNDLYLSSCPFLCTLYWISWYAPPETQKSEI